MGVNIAMNIAMKIAMGGFNASLMLILESNRQSVAQPVVLASFSGSDKGHGQCFQVRGPVPRRGVADDGTAAAPAAHGL